MTAELACTWHIHADHMLIKDFVGRSMLHTVSVETHAPAFLLWQLHA